MFVWPVPIVVLVAYQQHALGCAPRLSAALGGWMRAARCFGGSLYARAQHPALRRPARRLVVCLSGGCVRAYVQQAPWAQAVLDQHWETAFHLGRGQRSLAFLTARFFFRHISFLPHAARFLKRAGPLCSEHHTNEAASKAMRHLTAGKGCVVKVHGTTVDFAATAGGEKVAALSACVLQPAVWCSQVPGRLHTYSHRC